jgi:hypothetical protein
MKIKDKKRISLINNWTSFVDQARLIPVSTY